MSAALFPGSFDPVTNGHLDVAERALKLFDRLVVAVAVDGGKDAMFSVQERVTLLEKACAAKKLRNVEVASFDGLLIEALGHFGAVAVVRGLRAVSDFEFEFQMALMNREINKDCETIFLMPSPEYSFVSSRIIKEINRLGGDVSAFIPSVVYDALALKRRSKC